MSDLVQPSLPELTPENFINRELATIEFQKRVLALGGNPDVPLLERLKFLAIVGNNLDEFYMVRVGSIMQKLNLGISSTRPDGITPNQLIWSIRDEVRELFHRQRQMIQAVLDELTQQGVSIIPMSTLNEEQLEAVNEYFYDEVFPVLTPLAVDHARPFPFISNLSLNLGVYLERQDGDADGYEFARIKVPAPDILPRLVNLRRILNQYGDNDDSLHTEQFLWIEEIIQYNLSRLFPGMHLIESYPFRLLRNSDIDYEQEEDEELIDVKSIIEQNIRERRFGSVVRISVPENVSKRMLTRLIDSLHLNPNRDVYPVEGLLGSANLMELLQVDRPDLKYPVHVPRFSESMLQGQLFGAIRTQDILFHHPYDSFSPIEEFFRTAARDPDVLAIKTTLYRVGKNSPIVDALMEARDNDKQVTVLVELKARFDEENNLEWVQALERKGVHVIYGVEELPMKTHAKVTLVVRRELEGVRRYVHISTGNYNSSTARLYTDLGLFTCNPEIAGDVSRLFNRLTGYAPDTHYNHLLIAPEHLLESFFALIDNEIEAARAGKPARLIFKMNQLEEDSIIQKLYQASQAGVEIHLIVRGLCCLRPGVVGTSENIRVLSIVGRLLEHSRIYYFENAPGDQRIYMGSADLMRRNLLNRVEVVCPLLDPRLQERALRVMLTQMKDNVNAWQMQPDGSYERIIPTEDGNNINSQAIFTESSFGLEQFMD